MCLKRFYAWVAAVCSHSLSWLEDVHHLPNILTETAQIDRPSGHRALQHVAWLKEQMEIENPNNRTETLILPWWFPLECGLRVHVSDFSHRLHLGTQGIVHLSLGNLPVPRPGGTVRAVGLCLSGIPLMLPKCPGQVPRGHSVCQAADPGLCGCLRRLPMRAPQRLESGRKTNVLSLPGKWKWNVHCLTVWDLPPDLLHESSQIPHHSLSTPKYKSLRTAVPLSHGLGVWSVISMGAPEFCCFVWGS